MFNLASKFFWQKKQKQNKTKKTKKKNRLSKVSGNLNTSYRQAISLDKLKSDLV